MAIRCRRHQDAARSLQGRRAGRLRRRDQRSHLYDRRASRRDASIWVGLFAPKGTPKAIVNKLYAVSAEMLKYPDVKERYAVVGGPTRSACPRRNFTRASSRMPSATAKWSRKSASSRSSCLTIASPARRGTLRRRSSMAFENSHSVNFQLLYIVLNPHPGGLFSESRLQLYDSLH